MAGHVDFGEYGDLSFGGVGHEFADLILGVEAAVAFWGAVASGARWDAFGADCSEFGVAFDFDTPALVVGEV